MFCQGEVISYLQMCSEEGCNLQRGMNFRLKGGASVILMSIRPNAPYADKIEEDGKILIYEGHNIPKYKDSKEDPKRLDQPMYNPGRSLTQNGFFYEAAKKYANNKGNAELVKVYEKIKDGIWVFNGIFKLLDAWQEESNGRKVFKFKLELIDDENISENKELNLEHNRLIPTSVKIEVWKRDKGKCVMCGDSKNLHFDHILPFSKGGTSLTAKNIQLLCAKHNLAKSDKIE